MKKTGSEYSRGPCLYKKWRKNFEAKIIVISGNLRCRSQRPFGSALVRKLREKGFDNLLLKPRSELDLTNQHAVEVFFAGEKPGYVFLAAAKVLVSCHSYCF